MLYLVDNQANLIPFTAPIEKERVFTDDGKKCVAYALKCHDHVVYITVPSVYGSDPTPELLREFYTNVRYKYLEGEVVNLWKLRKKIRQSNKR